MIYLGVKHGSQQILVCTLFVQTIAILKLIFLLEVVWNQCHTGQCTAGFKISFMQ